MISKLRIYLIVVTALAIGVPRAAAQFTIIDPTTINPIIQNNINDSINRGYIPDSNDQLEEEANQDDTVYAAYPVEFVQYYLRECIEVQNGDPFFCGCTIKNIQQSYTLQEFISLEENLRQTGEIPQNLSNLVEHCVSQTIQHKLE